MNNQKIEAAVDGMDELFRVAENRLGSSERIGYSNYSYWASTWQVFRRNKVAMACLLLLCVILLFTFLQPFLPNQKDPTYCNINAVTGMQERNLPPSADYWFGTNSIGQDLWARIWSGTRTSLIIGLAVGFSDMVIEIGRAHV